MGVPELKNAKGHIVTVFGSSRVKPETAEYTSAYETGSELAKSGFVLCNGGFGGTMEAAARGAKEAGGKTIGIIAIAFGASANKWIDETIVVETPLDRMMRLIATGDAYVVLKGGTGTLLELAAVWELMNKGLISEKPIVVLGGFWEGVVKTLKDELAWEGLEDCTRFVTSVATPRECVAHLKERLM
jgi:uncharacterized protein (TIGR00725 family)